MEAAGVAQAVTERIHPVQWLVVRGISDHANEGKKALDDQKQTWRRYSVRNAAGLLRALLAWDGFRLAAGLRAPSTNGSESLARELARRLQVCTGGSWLAGIAFDVYTHAPRSGSGEAVDVPSSELPTLKSIPLSNPPRRRKTDCSSTATHNALQTQ